MNHPLTCAVLGAGRIGRMHALDLLKMSDVRLKTVLDKYKQTDWLPEQTNVQVTDDLRSILEDKEIDAIIIATSSSSHVELIRAILPTGKHIFSEKPVSFSSATLAELKEEIKTAGIKFQIGYNRRHDPYIETLKTRLRENEAGRMYMLKIINRDPERPPMSFIPKSGGMLFDFNAHDFDMIHFLSESKIKTIYTLGANLIDPKIGELGDIDTTLITMELENGALASVDCSRETGYGYDQQIEVFGSAGSLHVGNVRTHTLTASSKDGVRIAPPRYNFIERYREAYRIQMQRFVSWVLRNEKPTDLIGIEEGRRAILVAEAATRSLQSKRAETIQY